MSRKYFYDNICGALIATKKVGDHIDVVFDRRYNTICITDAASTKKGNWIAIGMSDDEKIATPIVGAVQCDKNGNQHIINMPDLLKEPKRFLKPRKAVVEWSFEPVPNDVMEEYRRTVDEVTMRLVEEKIKCMTT